MVQNLVHSQDTIVALATAQGLGALGIIRLSGKDSFSICQSVFKGKNLAEQASHTLQYGYIYDDETLIDEVVLSLFKAPKSFTTEDVIEISCHGSPFIIQKTIDLLIKKGARLAAAGEFTMRAFFNGRIDLAQAEAVADLIASESKASHAIALNQMRGGISSELADLREALVNFTALIELELDFGEEDVEFADRNDLLLTLHTLDANVQKLMVTFEYGNAIKNGVPVAIVGKPNAGKSSLLNTLLNENRAIVSSIAGTTRDTIEEVLNIDGIQFRFIDTAGLRKTNDEIEKIGISKAIEKIEQASVVIYLFDKNDTSIKEIKNDLKEISEDKIIFICPSKIDLYPDFDWNNWIADINNNFTHPITILGISSLAKDKSIDALKNGLVESIKGNVSANDVIVSNSRHFESLKNAKLAIAEVQLALKNNVSGDQISPHLKDVLHHIGNITGAIDVDKDILGTIFGKFCIGK